MKLYVKQNCPNSIEAISLIESHNENNIKVIFISNDDQHHYLKFSNNAPYLFNGFEYIGGLKELKQFICIEN
jgi:glutaredoxin